jgi:hypothetical protein
MILAFDRRESKISMREKSEGICRGKRRRKKRAKRAKVILGENMEIYKECSTHCWCSYFG